MDIATKLEILADAAKYDVACTSSGVNRSAKKGELGNTIDAGICHSFTADGRCITLLKVLMTNACIYNCAYCVNRAENEVRRAVFKPRELADLTIGFYRRNYIEGLFLSSGVIKSPDYTTELMICTLSILRNEYKFRGYIHAKAVPGTSPELVEQLGHLADRMSVNMELPSHQSLALLAPDKSKQNIVAPMRQIKNSIAEDRDTRALMRRNTTYYSQAPIARKTRAFAPAGQSTQMIIGATPESDYQILALSSALYRTLSLKRVFFSAYLPVNADKRLPNAGVQLNREHRLYQADWLMRFYKFDATAFAPKFGTVGTRQIEAEYCCAHAADKKLYRRRPRHPRPYAPQHHLLLAGTHCTQNTRVCPCWAINANDNRRHTRIGLPNTRPFQRPVPHTFVEARVLQRILTRER